ncbi:MAG: hypothetical protein R3362_06940 [Rhodothermales bacterium]|nr:hypothetical protein [Rhodothermales bacterium]
MTRFNLMPVLALAILTLVPTAAAQQQSISGYVVYVPGDATDFALADGRTLSNGALRGVLIEDDPESPIHLVSQNCAGTDLFGSDGTPIQSAGSCTGIDGDGDLYHVSYLNSPEQRPWSFTGGTGKFAGIEGGGTTEVVAVGPDGRVTIRYEGTMRTR